MIEIVLQSKDLVHKIKLESNTIAKISKLGHLS
jgi:hypothetical protein